MENSYNIFVSLALSSMLLVWHSFLHCLFPQTLSLWDSLLHAVRCPSLLIGCFSSPLILFSNMDRQSSIKQETKLGDQQNPDQSTCIGNSLGLPMEIFPFLVLKTYCRGYLPLRWHFGGKHNFGSGWGQPAKGKKMPQGSQRKFVYNSFSLF